MNPLQQTERDVLQQSQAWARAQLEEQLQRQADQVAMVRPQTGERLSNTRRRKIWKANAKFRPVRFTGNS
jgi:hypothetical protein